MRAVPRPQVRSAGTEGVLSALRLLQFAGREGADPRDLRPAAPDEGADQAAAGSARGHCRGNETAARGAAGAVSKGCTDASGVGAEASHRNEQTRPGDRWFARPSAAR